MSDGAFTFLSWARRGLAHAVNTDTVATTTIVPVDLVFNATEDPLPVRADLNPVGPGDIVGLDPSVIVRTWPKHEDLDSEWVSYPLIEFDQADLPWRYSPEASADSGGNPLPQVRPWFTLLVLKSADCTLLPATPEQPLAVLSVDPAKLPPADSTWAWAHTQVEGAGIDGTTQEQLRARLTGEPGLFVSRLMSPRLLEPNTEDVACVVPTFERGRLLGLRALVDGDNTPVRNTWATPDPVEFPAYYSWRFRTGTIGNFEFAARLIQPVPLPLKLGRRDMDVSEPGFGLDPASDRSLPVEGALMSVAAFEAPPPEWPATLRDDFITDLTNLLNEPADAADPEISDGSDPRLTPPLYGQWYAAMDRLTTPLPGGTTPTWFHDLNTDPRTRVGAALGTKVIQREQQALLASGWNQVEEIETLNDALRVLQLTRSLLGRLYARHFITQNVQRFFHLTLRLHAWVTCDGATVCGQVKGSSIPPAFMSSQWLRLTRPRGPVGRFQGRPDLDDFIPNLLEQFADCRFPVPEPPIPPGIHVPDDKRGRLECQYITDLQGLGSTTTLFWGLVILWVVRKLMVTQNGDCWWMALKALRYAINLIRVSIDPGDVFRRCKWLDGTLTVADIAAAPPMPGLTIPITFSLPPQTPTLPGVPGVDSDSPDALDARAALTRLITTLTLPPALSCPPPMDPDHCHEALTVTLDPVLTVGERVLQRRTVLFDWSPFDRLQPLFAAPSYERPMYLPLSELSKDWILPGINDMQRNSVGLAVTNQRFIEAYMMGLNHEMTRELLWNEFPTDQRGTYFRQFWDISGCVLDGSTTPPDKFRDVLPLRQWQKAKALGQNSPRTTGGGTSALLVLVVRAELIRKYPNVIVYLQRRNAATNRLTGEQRHPVFNAILQPDIALYGFDATVEEIRDDTSTNDWYFVLQEQPGEPKFTDPDPNVLHDGSVAYSDPATLGGSSGAIAEFTFLQPFRMGFAAKSLLLPEEP
jgi:hypothetical protein